MGKGVMLDIKWDGMDDLIRRIERQPVEIKQEADNILKNTSLRVEKRAKYYAPYDTGYLEQNIMAEPQGNLAYTVTSKAEYSVYQEWGTRKMPPHPFMIPAMEQEKPFMFQKIDNLLKKGLL